MTTEEKLKYFEESSLEEARKQASAMIEEYKVNLDKVEKEHRPGYGYNRVMNDQLFQTFYNEMKKEPFKDDRIKLLNAALAGSDFTSAQCLQLTKLYTFDDDRMEIMKIMYPRIVDKEAFFTVINTLTFTSSKDKMNDFVIGYGRR